MVSPSPGFQLRTGCGVGVRDHPRGIPGSHQGLMDINQCTKACLSGLILLDQASASASAMISIVFR